MHNIQINIFLFCLSRSKENYLLFVYLTSFQKHLIQRYGDGICLFDSTYKTTKYTVPLFFICVQTNMGFQVVASFLLGKETTSLIHEALQIIKNGILPGNHIALQQTLTNVKFQHWNRCFQVLIFVVIYVYMFFV